MTIPILRDVAGVEAGVDDVGGFSGSVGNKFYKIFSLYSDSFPLLLLLIFTSSIANSYFMVPISTANAAI